MSSPPDDFLGEGPLDAAVAALADRNRHHLEAMTPEEQADAVATWRELAIAVLVAARGAVGSEPAPDGHVGPGRAVIVFEDAGESEVTVHVSFHPELEEVGEDEVAATPAQAAALELLDRMGGEDLPE